MDSVSPVYPVREFAARAVAAAADAAAAVAAQVAGVPVRAAVDPELAYAWFAMSFTPQGWDLPSPWDPLSADYRARDGWIRLHTNAPHHRRAALAVLAAEAPPGSETRAEVSRTDVASRVAEWAAEDLEDAVVAAGGCAAVMRSGAEWDRHPQGAAVAAEPLISWSSNGSGPETFAGGDDGQTSQVGNRAVPERPLAGIRVLDLTRVIAGPVATRFLAGLGAQVLRLDPPDWSEPALEAEMTPGKACARLDASLPEGRAKLRDLAAAADVVVHGYRPGALAGLGLGGQQLRAGNPRVVDVALSAYGWSGPWAQRRGFDSLVQMSTGIADAGMAAADQPRPVPLPVQALDHATGYLAAAAALRGLLLREDGRPVTARLSLARTAASLRRAAVGQWELEPATATQLDRTPLPEQTGLGPGLRLPAPLRFTAAGGAPVPEFRWDVPAGPLGRDAPEWPRRPWALSCG